jgi:hypothetical protein
MDGNRAIPPGAPAAKSAGRPNARRGGAATRGDFVRLVPEDGLVFRVLTAVSDPSQQRRLARAFRAGFCSVWGRLPGADRRQLLAYWAEPGLSYPPPRPLVQVLGHGLPAWDEPEVKRFGAELNFHAVAVGDPDTLRGVITKGLALAYLVASREHGRMVMKLIEDPLQQWEARQGAGATDEARDRLLDRLEADFLRWLAGALSALLRRWGLAASALRADGERGGASP